MKDLLKISTALPVSTPTEMGKYALDDKILIGWFKVTLDSRNTQLLQVFNKFHNFLSRVNTTVLQKCFQDAVALFHKKFRHV